MERLGPKIVCCTCNALVLQVECSLWNRTQYSFTHNFLCLDQISTVTTWARRQFAISTFFVVVPVTNLSTECRSRIVTFSFSGLGALSTRHRACCPRRPWRPHSIDWVKDQKKFVLWSNQMMKFDDKCRDERKSCLWMKKGVGHCELVHACVHTVTVRACLCGMCLHVRMCVYCVCVCVCVCVCTGSRLCGCSVWCGLVAACMCSCIFMNINVCTYTHPQANGKWSYTLDSRQKPFTDGMEMGPVQFTSKYPQVDGRNY